MYLIIAQPKILKSGPCSLEALYSGKKNSWQIKLHNRSTSSKLQKNVSIPEVILQSMFSRNFTSFSKQKRVNAHGHNSATRYFDDETSGELYSRGLTLPCSANNLILKKMRENVPFPRASHIYTLKSSEKHSTHKQIS